MLLSDGLDSEGTDISLIVLLAQLQNTFKIQNDACLYLGNGYPSSTQTAPSSGKHLPNIPGHSKLCPVIDGFLLFSKASVRYQEESNLEQTGPQVGFMKTTCFLSYLFSLLKDWVHPLDTTGQCQNWQDISDWSPVNVLWRTKSHVIQRCGKALCRGVRVLEKAVKRIPRIGQATGDVG